MTFEGQECNEAFSCVVEHFGPYCRTDSNRQTHTSTHDARKTRTSPLLLTEGGKHLKLGKVIRQTAEKKVYVLSQFCERETF